MDIYIYGITEYTVRGVGGGAPVPIDGAIESQASGGEHDFPRAAPAIKEAYTRAIEVGRAL